MIHTIGDSNALTPWKDMRGVSVNWMGPVLVHSVGVRKLNMVDLSKLDIKKDDYVVFSFGAIDCRLLINKLEKNKYIGKNNDYKKIIDKLVDKYFNVLKMNEKFANNAKFCLYNITPVFPFDSNALLTQRSWKFIPKIIQNFILRKVIKRNGSDATIKKYLEYYNLKLKENCEKNNYIFIDVYKKYSDENGYLNVNLADGEHVHDPKYLIEFMKINMNYKL